MNTDPKPWLSCWVLVLDLVVQNGKKFLLFLNRNKRTDFFYFMTHATIATGINGTTGRYLITGSVKT
jgi:hypothetical protein